MLWCGYAGSSFEVKIETGSNDAMEIKTEADSNYVTECPHDGGPSVGMFGVYSGSALLAMRSLYYLWPSPPSVRLSVLPSHSGVLSR